MNPNIEKLIALTTIVKAEDNNARSLVFGDEYYAHRFQLNPNEDQINTSNLEDSWNRKWDSFGDAWSEERQDYRNLYDTFHLFYFSFLQLRKNKYASIYTDNPEERLTSNNSCGTNLWGMYHSGKKCIDLLKNLGLLTSSHPELQFCDKFSETRNKLIEHNHNPKDLKMRIDPSIWSLAGTNSLLEVSIHTSTEREFTVYVDYYDDYFRLENVCSEIIKAFR